MKVFGLAALLSFVWDRIRVEWLDPLPQCDRCGRDTRTLYPFRVTDKITENICGGCMRRRWGPD
jgi:hypothetical protein